MEDHASHMAIFLSRASNPAAALGELIGETAGPIGSAPDLSLLILPTAFADSIDHCTKAAQVLLQPSNLVVMTAETIPGIAVGGGSFPTSAMLCAASTGVSSLWLPPLTNSPTDRQEWEKLLRESGENYPDVRNPTAILLSLSNQDFEDEFASVWGTIYSSGDLLSLSFEPGDRPRVASVLGETVREGAILIIFWSEKSISFATATPAQQGLIPVGDPMTVTRADGVSIFELGGVPAAVALMRTVIDNGIPDDALELSDLMIGVPTDPYSADYRDGPFSIHPITDLVISDESICSADSFDVGDVIQFMRYSPLSILRPDSEVHDGLLITRRWQRSDARNAFETRATSSEAETAAVRLVADRIKHFPAGSSESSSLTSALIRMGSGS